MPFLTQRFKVSRICLVSDGGATPKAMEIASAVASFVRHLEVEKRASPNTVSAYRRDLDGLAAFAAEKSIADVEAIDVYLLRGWLATLARTLEASSTARKIAAVRSWMKWLFRQKTISKNPAAEIASPKVRRPLPTFLSVDAANEVVETPDGSKAAGLRDRAILELLYGSGLRVSELTSLSLSELDLGTATARRPLGSAERETKSVSCPSAENVWRRWRRISASARR